MRVLFVNENIGGHRTVHVNLRRALAERPDTTAEFLDVQPPGLLGKLVRAPVPGLAHLDVDLQSLRGQLVTSLEVRRRLPKLLSRFDAVHVYTQNAALLSAGLLREVPMVVSTDSTNALNAYRLPYRTPTRWTKHSLRPAQALERQVLAAARLIVAASDFVADSLRDDYGIGADRLRVVPFGVWVPDSRAGATPGPPRPRLAFVGHHMKRKGGLRLFELHQRHLADVCDLLLVTTDRVPVGRNVTVVDDLSAGDQRLWDLLGSSSIFVFPSPIDQSPNAVLEAMAAGLPVVGLAAGALPEMVIDGVTGIVVPPADDDALLDAIRVLLDRPDLRAAMGRAGRERAREHYDIRTTAARLLDLLEEARHRPATAI